jgi:hypothetical protein
MANEPIEGSQIVCAVDKSGIPIRLVVDQALDPPRLLCALDADVEIGDVEITSQIPGTGATNLGKAEDAAHGSGNTGVMALGVRKAANGPLSGSDGDYEPLQTDANGHLKVNVIDSLPAGSAAIGKLSANSGVDIGDVDITSIAAGDNNIGNVDIASAIPAGANAIGKLAANSGVDIGDVDVTSVNGQSADGATAAGLPVRVAGKDGAGNTQDIAVNTGGIVFVAGATASADGTANMETRLYRADSTLDKEPLGVFPYGFNGSTWDRIRTGSGTSTDPHHGAVKMVGGGGELVLAASATKTTNFSGTEKTSLGGFADLIVTLNITTTNRSDGDETYDFYITTGDGVSSWDIVHFPQIAATGTHRHTAIISGRVLPQNVTTAGPGVSAVTTATIDTIAAGADQGIKTLGAGIVRHGPWGDRINHELVVAGTTPSVTYSVTITPKV